MLEEVMIIRFNDSSSFFWEFSELYSNLDLLLMLSNL